MEIPVDPGRPIKHVSRKAIYTRLEARIDYLRDFLDFNSDDVEALTNGNKHLKALIPVVVNAVYKKLLERDITARAFMTHDTAIETPIEDFFSEQSPQIQRRKMFLRWYLIKLCSDPTKMEFWQYLNKVGMMHCGQERLHRLNVEYVHVGACLGFVQDVFTEALMSHPHLSLQRKIALLRAINKIIWIQNDLFAKWRLRDGEEFADEMSEVNVDEREGYVGGKKFLGSSSGSSTTDDDHSILSSIVPSKEPSIAPSAICPFSGVSQGGTQTKIWAEM